MAKTEKAPPPWLAWTNAVLIILAFAVGGTGLIVGWWLFWVGVGMLAVALVMGRVIRLMDFTEEYSLDGERVEPGTRTVHG